MDLELAADVGALLEGRPRVPLHAWSRTSFIASKNHSTPSNSRISHRTKTLSSHTTRCTSRLHVEPSLNASSLRSDVMGSTKTFSSCLVQHFVFRNFSFRAEGVGCRVEGCAGAPPRSASCLVKRFGFRMCGLRGLTVLDVRLQESHEAKRGPARGQQDIWGARFNPPP